MLFFHRFLFLLGILGLAHKASAQQLLDDFDRPNDTELGMPLLGVEPWVEAHTLAPTSVAVAGGHLRMRSSVATSASLADMAAVNVGALYNTTLGSNSCQLVWAFNMRQSRPDPGGFTGSGYGMAVVIAGSAADLRSGNGYAVVMGNPSTPDPVRLVRYSGANGLGQDANLTQIAAVSVPQPNAYFSVRVTYNPTNHLWTLSCDASPIAFSNPLLASTWTATGTNATWVNTPLPYFGCYWNHSTGVNESALFDNVHIPVPCSATPTVNAVVPDVHLSESHGQYPLKFTIVPTANVAGTLSISLTDVGTTYGTDYITTPDGSAGSFTVNVPAHSGVVTIPVELIDDLIGEPIESVRFTATAFSNGTIGIVPETRITIVDDDEITGTVLGAGDIVVLGVNSDNGSHCSAETDDRISFVCFKDIVPGTTIDLTDNAYSSNCPGPWNDTEGSVRMLRLGSTIPAGTVITWRIQHSYGSQNVIGMYPDAQWACTPMGGTNNLTNVVNLANAPQGDQIHFLHGGVWTDLTPGSATGDASYSGNAVAAFTTNGQWNGAVCNTNNSGMHPDLRCVPTVQLSGNFWKYNGDISMPRTQAQWLVELANTANWTSYTNCVDYFSLGHDWHEAPVLPVLPGIGEHGRWTGVKSSDWFDCRNWADFTLPTNTTPVLIDHNAVTNCAISTPNILGLNTTSCASLTVRSIDPAIGRSLSLTQNNHLYIYGNTVVERMFSAGPECTISLDGSSSINTQDLRLAGFTFNSQQGRLLSVGTTTTLTIRGNLRIEAGGYLNRTNSWTNLAGHFTNAHSATSFVETGSTLVLNGSTDQEITTTGFEQTFHRLRVFKPGSSMLRLNHSIFVRDTLSIPMGIILCGSNTVTMGPLSGVRQANHLGYVEGPVVKRGNADFVYPVGAGGYYRPVRLSDNSGNTGSGFRVLYSNASPRVAYSEDALEAGLDHISDCEYWMIDRSGGTANATVWLSWDDEASCGVNMSTDLRVARWNGSTWENRGHGGILDGMVATSSIQTAFSPWTLASATTMNPLPIELLEFRAEDAGNRVDLSWRTATERDNAYFVVERSVDMIDFIPVAEQAGAGNSQGVLHYSDVDRAPVGGWSYYRLQQVDTDGTFTYGPVVPLYRTHGSAEVAVHASPGQLHLFHHLPATTGYRVLDATGRPVLQGVLGSEGQSVLPLPRLASGTYLIQLGNGSTLRFLQ